MTSTNAPYIRWLALASTLGGLGLLVAALVSILAAPDLRLASFAVAQMVRLTSRMLGMRWWTTDTRPETS